MLLYIVIESNKFFIKFWKVKLNKKMSVFKGMARRCGEWYYWEKFKDFY